MRYERKCRGTVRLPLYLVPLEIRKGVPITGYNVDEAGKQDNGYNPG
jgi:hypothetical protein